MKLSLLICLSFFLFSCNSTKETANLSSLFEQELKIIKLKNANEFATQLNVHTNHLNKALKEITGKTTSQWIAERNAKEAKALLLNSNWDIAEIGYSLGFEHPSNFNIFFKNQTGKTPNSFRKQDVAIS